MSTVTTRAPQKDVRTLRRLGSLWWIRVTAIWLASRVVTTALVLFFAAHEGPTFWAPAHPGYFRFAQFWDSGWFHTIATTGYPSRLQLDASGHVLPNAWAFLPAYPAVVDLTTAATGIPWDIASVLVAGLCSLGAVLVLDRLLRALGLPASFVVALVCFGPLSALFQVAYAESMGMLLLCASLLLLVRRHYLPLIPLLLLADLTRPIGVPLAVVVGIHVLLRLLHRTADPPLRGARLVVALVAVAVAGVGAVLWPLVAWAVTGDRGAYLASETAWRRSHVGEGPFVPFVSWLTAAERIAPGPAGILLLAVGAAVFAALLLAVPQVRRLGADVRIWSATYGAYLLAVFDPQSSTFRLLLPLFPMLGAFATVRSRVLRGVLLVLGIAGQFLWIAATWAQWHISGWSPP
ncbi:MAG: hypothetical protein HIU86_04375 [Acidobacteria bacterium]|nr:hypothetical protein [Acidobacteriota bacterium]